MAWSTSLDLALDFRPRPQRGKVARKDRRYLLWPAIAYRVAAPEPRPRALDRFERAVLGLCRAGAHDAATLARRLHLSEELTRFIRDALIARALLDSRGLITDRGAALLRQDADLALDRMITGYVFQDPFTEALWPRFVDTLTPCTLEYGDGKYPELLLGSTGSPFRARPFVVELPVAAPPDPSPADILRALAAHTVADRRRRADDDDPGDLPAPPPVAERRVSFIDDAPLPCHLATYLYVPEDERDWRVCDPFGLGDSPRFKDWIETRAHRSTPLSKHLDDILAPMRHQDASQLQQKRADLRDRAERRLRARFRDLPPAVAEHALELAVCVEEGEIADRDALRRLADQAALYARKTLEALFATLAEHYPLRDVWRPFYPDGTAAVDDPAYLAEFVTAAARAVGLATPLPAALTRLRPHHIKAASHPDGGWSLRPRIVATILAARLAPHHPLHAAARRQPRLCDELDLLASLSSRELHHRPDRSGAPPPIQRLADRIYDLLAVFYPDRP